MKYPTPEHEAADRLLVKLAGIQGMLATLEAEAEAKLNAVKLEHRAPREALQARQAELEKELLALARKHRDFLFSGESCRVELPAGALLYELRRYVRKAKDLTPARLEAAGFPEAVRVAKSVDWDALAAWPDERLFLVATDRRVKEEFGYELKAAGPVLGV
jgi:phage host-nuclease inhibitor protein Gam